MKLNDARSLTDKRREDQVRSGCGLRRKEIHLLDSSDIEYNSGMLVVRKGKFGKTRTIALSDKVLNDLREYLLYERSVHTNCIAFLLDEKGERLKAFRLNNKIKELVMRTNNQKIISKNISLHGLRHSIATHLLDNGADFEFVQDFLGHTAPDSTHIYSRNRKRRQMIRQAVEWHEVRKNISINQL